jgi:hypothetical protein
MAHEKKIRSRGPKTRLSLPTSYNSFVPDRMRATLKFAHYFTVASTDTIVLNQFSANSIYDPGLTFTATQALGAPGLLANYSNFVVVGSKILARGRHGSTSSGVGTTQLSSNLAVFPAIATTAANDRDSVLAQPGCKNVLFDVGGVNTVAQSLNIPKFVGLPFNSYVADEKNWGAYNATPTNVMSWYVEVDSSVTQTGVNVDVQVEITYDVIFFKKRTLDLTFEAALMRIIGERCERELQARAENEKKHLLVLAEREKTQLALLARAKAPLDPDRFVVVDHSREFKEARPTPANTPAGTTLPKPPAGFWK